MTITLLHKNQDVPLRRVTGYLSGTYTAATVTNALLTTTSAEVNGPPLINSVTGAVSYPLQHVVIGAGVLTINLGFVPKYINIFDATQGTEISWFDGMAAGNYIYAASAGTTALETDSALVVNSGTTGTSPVTFEPAASIVLTLTGLTFAVSNNDSVFWTIEG